MSSSLGQPRTKHSKGSQVAVHRKDSLTTHQPPPVFPPWATASSVAVASNKRTDGICMLICSFYIRRCQREQMKYVIIRHTLNNMGSLTWAR